MATQTDGEILTDAEPSEIGQIKQELRREHDMYMRALADFDNYRRRVERERESEARRGKRDIILSLLEVLDGFDRALKHVGDAPKSVSTGFEALHRKLLSMLEAQGVTPFSAVGERFDPKMHEAIGSLDNDEYEPGRVAEEVQRGYRWEDELLRPARVLVSQ